MPVTSAQALLKDLFAADPSKRFLLAAGAKPVSYGEFYQSAVNIGRQLQQRGIKPGSRLMIQAENSEKLLALYVACALTGAVACPLDPLLPAGRAAAFQSRFAPALQIDDPLLDALSATAAAPGAVFPEVPDDADFLVVFSSGSTGEPKGIVHSLRSMMDSAASFAELSGLNADSVVYHHFPMFYMAGIFVLLLGSALLLAGLFAEGPTLLREPALSRDHTERMLRLFGIAVKTKGNKISIVGGQRLFSADIEVPADISSAAFFIVAALIAKDSKLRITSVGINPTRTGILDILEKMGGKVRIKGYGLRVMGGESMADLMVESSELKATTIKGDIIPRAIDELPIIMVAATQAKGTTRILGAKELRVKETDRIKSMSEGLSKMGADIKVIGDDIYIKGPAKLKGAVIKSLGDHRTAMSFVIAGLIAEGETIIEDTECIFTSFPNFEQILKNICR